jgi:hypothetical protein
MQISFQISLYIKLEQHSYHKNVCSNKRSKNILVVNLCYKIMKHIEVNYFWSIKVVSSNPVHCEVYTLCDKVCQRLATGR